MLLGSGWRRKEELVEEMEGRKGGEREEEKCLPQSQRYLTEDILSSEWVLFLPLRNVFLQQGDSGVQSEHLCAGPWSGLSVHPDRGGPPACRGGCGPTSGGMPRGPAERDGKRSRSFPKPSKLPGFLFSMDRVMGVETLNFL